MHHPHDEADYEMVEYFEVFDDEGRDLTLAQVRKLIETAQLEKRELRIEVKQLRPPNIPFQPAHAAL